MVAAFNQRRAPFSLVVTGEAESWEPALRSIVGPAWLRTYRVQDGGELLDIVRSGVADAAVIDEQENTDVLQMLRMIRRMNAALPVVVLTYRQDRRWLENALRLAAFSVVIKPLELEALLRQIHRMMFHIDEMMRRGPHE